MRKFLIKVSYTLLPLWLLAVAAVVWFSLFVCPQASGDIGRLQLIPFGNEYDSTLAKNYIPEMHFTTVYDLAELNQARADLITVGTSFSERGVDGYQNYLAQHGLKVVNCERHLYFNPITFAYEIMNLGIIDSTNTRVLVVECGERGVDEYMYGFEPKSSLQLVRADKKKLGRKSPNEWSLARFRDYVVFRTGLHELPCLDVMLDNDLFSYTGDERHLFFYADDIKQMGINPRHEEKMKELVHNTTILVTRSVWVSRYLPRRSGFSERAAFLSEPDFVREAFHMEPKTAVRFWQAFAPVYFGTDRPLRNIEAEVRPFAGLKTILVERDMGRPMPTFREALKSILKP